MDCDGEIYKSLLWDITRQCNLNCIHCYNSGNVADIESLDVKANHIKILDTVIGLKVNHIHLLGGEPLLADGLYDLIEYANLKKYIFL